MKRYGNDYGGYVLPDDAVRSDSIIYSFGLGEDASFAIDMVTNHGCKIHLFDPTPRAILYYRNCLSQNTNLIYYDFGIWSKDGIERFYLPRDPRHVSCSIANLQGTRQYFEGNVKRLKTIMQQLNHENIDVLKLDIEGAEKKVIPDIIESGIRPEIICIELHRGVEYLTPVIENAGYYTYYHNGTKTFIHENSHLPDSI